MLTVFGLHFVLHFTSAQYEEQYDWLKVEY